MRDFTYLEGIEFEHGVNDCYTMMQRVFKDFANISLSNYARPDDWWIGDAHNFYVDNYKKEGFFLVEDPDDYFFLDTFLIAIPDNRVETTPPNHCAMYIGDGKVIHHRLGKRSQIKPYQGMLRNFTTHVIRHKDVKPENTSSKKIDLMDHILPHKRYMLEEALKNGNS